MVKLRLNYESAADKTQPGAALGTMVMVFDAALRLLSPFMPFITEELWQQLNYGSILFDIYLHPKSIALARYPQPDDFYYDAEAIRDMALLQELIVTVRALRKEIGVPEREGAPIMVYATDMGMGALAARNAEMLARMARVSAVTLADGPLSGNGVKSTANFDVQVIYERVIDVAAECERLTKDLAKYEKGLQAAEKQLGNEAFMAKAPAHIVDGLKKQAAETKLLYDKTRAALDELGCVTN
jgi:valyl-tRNA synthetase